MRESSMAMRANVHERHDSVLVATHDHRRAKLFARDEIAMPSKLVVCRDEVPTRKKEFVDLAIEKRS